MIKEINATYWNGSKNRRVTKTTTTLRTAEDTKEKLRNFARYIMREKRHSPGSSSGLIVPLWRRRTWGRPLRCPVLGLCSWRCHPDAPGPVTNTFRCPRVLENNNGTVLLGAIVDFGYGVISLWCYYGSFRNAVRLSLGNSDNSRIGIEKSMEPTVNRIEFECVLKIYRIVMSKRNL